MHVLRQRIQATYAAALQSGALKPIQTSCEVVSSATSGVNFSVRVVSNLARKDKASAAKDATKSAGTKGKSRFNPFLPYEEAMFVEDSPPSHVVLLNKFPVVDEHVLIVTREYEEQNSLLTAEDFGAMWRVLGEIDGVAFYNAGTISGASQHHKHMQVVGGNLVPGLQAGRVPFDALFTKYYSDNKEDGLFSLGELPFAHLAANLSFDNEMGPRAAGEMLMGKYTRALNKCIESVDGLRESSSDTMPFPYNLIVTRRWMLLVPRREECFESVSVNSLGFTGCLLVRNEDQVKQLVEGDAMKVLQHTGYER